MHLRWRIVSILVLGLCVTGCVRVSPSSQVPPETPTLRTAITPITWDGPDFILFSANDNLLVMRPDGSQRHQVNTSGAFNLAPAWSTDGRYVAYISIESGNEDIFVGPWNRLGDFEWSTNITKSPDIDESTPSWAPDGQQIAFSAHRQDTWGIFTAELLLVDDDVAPVLLRQRRLTANSRFDGLPVWSPDNTWIAFTSDRGFRWQIYLTHTSGTHTIPMTGTTNLRSTAYPAWSPDGKKMAFASTFDGSWDIYTMNTDGSELTQLTSHPGQDWHPSWSPDGKWIAFVSDRSGAGDIYLTSADGLTLIQLTDNDEAEDSPAWEIPYPVSTVLPGL